jgi:hypothetical protein
MQMKNFCIAVCILYIGLSCSKKTVPSKTINESNTTAATTNNNTVTNSTITDTASAAIVTADSLAMAAVNNAMVVADGYGNLVTPQENLPANSGVKYNSLELSKSFTVQQRANLQARYKTVPPRVLYVPEQQASSSLKGSYYIYKKKFWYWKKGDGFYYLDPKYYQ